MSERPLDADAIRALIAEVADELKPDGSHTLIIVGGALLALRGLRTATRDVDSGQRLDDELKRAIARVAKRNDLAPAWLNDAASAHLPATFKEIDCDVLLDHPNLVALGAPVDQVFLMKVAASRAVDTDDLEAMWPQTSFESPEAAADAFYKAYPHEERDPHLADHIRNIV